MFYAASTWRWCALLSPCPMNYFRSIIRRSYISRDSPHQNRQEVRKPRMAYRRRGIIITVGNYISDSFVEDSVILHNSLGAEGLDLCSGNGRFIPRRPYRVENSIAQLYNSSFKVVRDANTRIDLKHTKDLRYSYLNMPFHRPRVPDAGKDFAGNKSGVVGI